MTDPAPVKAGGTILGRRAVEASFEGLAADPVEEVVEVDEPETAPSPARVATSGGARWSIVGCAVFALAALVLALLGLQQRSALQHEQQQNNQLRDVAGRTIVALTSYDYQLLDQWKKAVLRGATGSFQNQFQAGFAGFEQTYVAEHNRATGSLQGVWVGPVESGKASVVVLVQITVTSLTGTHTLEPYVQVTLLKVAGQWRVDDVQATFDTSGSGGVATSPPARSPATSVP